MDNLPRHAGSPTSTKSSWMLFKPAFLSISKDLKPLRSTAYLDGLRGLAAFLVYVTHHIGVAHDFGAPILSGFGAEGNYSLLTLPFLRVLFSGSHFAVPIFFVISGFVLSRGPLRVIHAKEGDLGKTLASAIFRRGIRLWLPVIGTTFTYMIIRHLGIWADYPKLQSSVIAEFGAYVKELIRFTYVLRIHENPFIDLNLTTFSYNPHTWTIALEYQGSILLFIVVLAFSSFKPRARMTITAALALYFVLQGSWVSFCFLCGAIIAEIDLLEIDFLRLPSQGRTLTLYTCLIAGLWLASMPTVELRAESKADLAANPGWSVFAALVPSCYEDIKPYWLSWGAVCVVFAVSYIQTVRSFFELPFLQYLGKISFAFYLVHGPVLQVVAVRVYHIFGQRSETFGGWLAKYDNWLPLPSFGPFGLEFSFLASHLIILPITFYCAEIVERIFDAPSVRCARWCYQYLAD